MNDTHDVIPVRGESAGIRYPFTEADSQRAYDEWGANCGPNALAFALQVPLDRIRGAIPGFEEKRYTSPTMMAAALGNLGVGYRSVLRVAAVAELALVRVQFTGPWTAPGANPKWAYGHTHWIAAWRWPGLNVFDVNGGVMSFEEWKAEIIPALTGAIPRADGGWRHTHVWQLEGWPHA
jgi:hypothetical protein